MAVVIVFMSVLTLLAGCFMAATPWLMPPTECFSVTVPPSARNDSRIRRYRKSYALVVGMVAVACALSLGFVLSQMLEEGSSSPESQSVLASCVSTATLVPLVVGMGLMLHYRSRVRALKQTEGWSTDGHQAAAVMCEDVPRPISLAWNLLHVVLALAMGTIALTLYDRYPSQIPMSTDFAGHVTFVPKSSGAVLFPAIFAGYLGLVFAICHAFVIVSKRPIDPEAPATSALAYGRFARAQSILLLVGGLLTSAGVGILYTLTALGIVSIVFAATALMVLILTIVIAVGIVSVRLGQSGAKLAAELRPSDRLVKDDDAQWPLGVFYFNREDPSVVVPKRFGIGWTINCARPAAWLLVAAIVLVTLVFVVLVNALVTTPYRP